MFTATGSRGDEMIAKGLQKVRTRAARSFSTTTATERAAKEVRLHRVPLLRRHRVRLGKNRDDRGVVLDRPKVRDVRALAPVWREEVEQGVHSVCGLVLRLRPQPIGRRLALQSLLEAPLQELHHPMEGLAQVGRVAVARSVDESHREGQSFDREAVHSLRDVVRRLVRPPPAAGGLAAHLPGEDITEQRRLPHAALTHTHDREGLSERLQSCANEGKGVSTRPQRLQLQCDRANAASHLQGNRPLLQEPFLQVECHRLSILRALSSLASPPYEQGEEQQDRGADAETHGSAPRINRGLKSGGKSTLDQTNFLLNTYP
eukprot:scaffold3323_cov279-Pinguiococcus_pyrenoidosus.AAC.8